MTEALIPLEARPFNAETPLARLAEAITPTALFYVRNHFDAPALDERRLRLRVGGVVERPLDLSLADLRDLPRSSLTVTLECAGNGRALMTPAPGGTPWRYGAVSTARFTGTPLAGVLDRAGLRPDAVEVLFAGADHGEVAPARSVAFERSLPREVALRGDLLLAWEMNGQPLTLQHGSPLRLVVPGWYGVASVKWLVGITALDRPFEGYYQREKYVYEGEPGTAPAPVTTIRVRAVIARPTEGETVGPGTVEVTGTAWSGEGRVERVLVSADDGATWEAAEVGRGESPLAAVPWRLSWAPRGPGEISLSARAADSAGNIQPLTPIWNRHGYGNNVVQTVRVRVRGSA